MNKKIIDLSHHNIVNDWNKVKNNVDGVIIRLGYGDNLKVQDDVKCERFLNAVKNKNIPYAVYFYSYANNMSQLKSEIEHIIRLYNEYKLSFDTLLFVDFEEDNTKEFISNNFILYFEELQKKGFSQLGLYCNEYWYNTVIKDITNTDLALWIAKYSDNIPNINTMYQLWQYTSKGEIDGVVGNVDISYDITEILSCFNVETKETNTTKYKIGDKVRFSTCYKSSTDSIDKHINANNMIRNTGTITKIKYGTNNPYLLDDGFCWVNDGDIREVLED